MRIAFDGSGLVPPLTGVGNYIGQLLGHLLRVEHASDYWLMAHRPAYVQAWLNGRVRAAQPYFPSRLLWMQCLLPLSLRLRRPDVVHFTNAVAPLAAAGRAVLTVHDLSLLRFPGMYRPRELLVQRPFVAPSVRRARAIIAVSQHSKAELVRTLGIAPERVTVIYEAPAPHFTQPISSEESFCRLARYGWDDCACNLLYVGRIEPRKNAERLVQALALLHARGRRAHLWLVGQAGWHSDSALRAIAAHGLEAHVHRTGYVPAGDLRAFYHGCTAFVFPSLHEGFGLPVVEAMASGAPSVLSDTPALREVGGDAALYADPLRAECIAAELGRLLADPALRADLRVRGQERAGRFSWTEAARQTLEVYRAGAGLPAADDCPPESGSVCALQAAPLAGKDGASE